jgi:general secretion pathway protein B
VPQAELSREVAAPAAPPIESEPDPDGGVPQFRELPQSARGEREEPNINVHVYSEDPGQRFVIIRMRRYREGERLEADGPVVERITRDGAVLKDPRSGLRYRVSR